MCIGIRKSYWAETFYMTRRHVTTEILTIAFFAVAIPTLNSFVFHEVRPGTDLSANLKVYALAFVSMFALTAGLMFVFSIILRRKTRSIDLLKENVVRAIRQALDESSLNPHLANRKHEHLTRETSKEP